MKLWWTYKDDSGETNGEKLNKILVGFFKEQKNETPVNNIQQLDAEKFTAVFNGVNVCNPVPDFYSFFNARSKTSVRYIKLPRVRNIPYVNSRKRIKHKFDKHFFRLKHISKIHIKTIIKQTLLTDKNGMNT